jgi:dipeptidase D
MDQATHKVIDLFEEISRIPRCSKNEEQISRWLCQWAESKGYPFQRDATGNLVIQVPATPGMEKAPVVILQGHMDMVCEKRDGSQHDFAKDPIHFAHKGEWLSAKETTLGADNGIALAIALALIVDPQVSHPPMELFFTVDEETGLTGVKGMDASLLSGKILINLDSEDEGVFVVGCAGGKDTILRRSLEKRIPKGNDVLIDIVAQGMKGGHSGVDIAKHRANANKVMARLLDAGMEVAPFRLVDLKGGTGRNVIPRACRAVVAVAKEDSAGLIDALRSMAALLEKEFSIADPDLNVQIKKNESAQKKDRCTCLADTKMAVNLLAALPSGPIEMEIEFPLTVRTSANLAMVEILDGELVVTTSQRSSIPSRLDAACLAVEATGRLAGATVQTGKGYPPWPMDPDSALLARCTTLYKEMFGKDPGIQIMHAGLECGVIGDRCPGMDMVSLGPTLENPHSPSERLHVPSVGKVWTLMVALLGSLKDENGWPVNSNS